MHKHLFASFAAAIVLSVCGFSLADDVTVKEEVTLLGMLSEWRYPESKFNGAQISDAAVKDISAVKSKAVLTTPDSFEKVMDFYRKKLNVDANGKNLGEKAGERITTDRSVLLQDVSGDRDSKLFVIAINGTKSSTTLVVSRNAGENETLIAWSNYRQVWP